MGKRPRSASGSRSHSRKRSRRSRSHNHRNPKRDRRSRSRSRSRGKASYSRSCSRDRAGRDQFGRGGGSTHSASPERRRSLERSPEAQNPLLEKRKALPIWSFKDIILETVSENQFVVIVGQTGSGKTTQISQFLADAEGNPYTSDGRGIAVTQPRRVAAVSVAKRVAEERQCSLGSEVGYTVRFQNRTSERTIIKYVTDGSLLREALENRNLERYNVIVLDEAHERSVSTDVLFGLLKQTAKARPEFRVIITSATLDVNKFSTYFDECPTLTVPGRLFPVDVVHNPVLTDDKEKARLFNRHSHKKRQSSMSKRAFQACPDNYVSRALDICVDIHFNKPNGDVLLFLTGQAEIDKACAELTRRCQDIYDNEEDMWDDNTPTITVLPLYGALPPADQMAVFAETPHGCRKVVICTNIAETSLTVDGIVYVIDAGFVKEKYYNPKTGMESLDVVLVSKVAAEQRKGRAGRTRDGICYRLYEQEMFEDLEERALPEIQRISLSTVILTLKAMGVEDVLNFDFIDPPEREGLIDAMKELYCMEALDEDGKLQQIGHEMAKFPLDPALSRVLVEASRRDCSTDMASLVAILSVPNIYYGRGEEIDEKRGMLHSGAAERYGLGDMSSLLYVLESFREELRDGGERYAREWCQTFNLNQSSLREADNIRKQLLEQLDEAKLATARFEGSSGELWLTLMEAFSTGFYQKSAKAQDGGVFFVRNKGAMRAFIHPSSILFQKEGALNWVVFRELVATSKAYMRCINPVKWEWLEPLVKRQEKMDPYRLLGIEPPKEEITPNTALSQGRSVHEVTGKPAPVAKRNDEKSVSAARARYLARKKKK